MKSNVICWLALIVTACSPSLEPAADGGLDAGPEDAGPGDATDSGGSRARCDEEGETCCPDGSCGGDLPCVDGLCGFATCGALGEPCCAASTCDPTSGLVCEDGVCVERHCGSEGSACCAGEPACRDDFVCHAGSCLRCGDAGEECCPNGTCDGDLHCLDERGPPGQCVEALPPCGGRDETCCREGAACEPGLGCVAGPPGSIGGTCLPGPACGGDRRVCCDDEPRCGAGFLCVAEPDGVDRCQRCGAYLLTCCEGAAPCSSELTCIESSCVLPP